MRTTSPSRWAMLPGRTILALALSALGAAAHAAECAKVPATMRAIQLVDYGGPDKLQPATIPVAAPKAGEVLVEVHAASVNPIDWKLREGQGKGWWPLELPAILGRDVAGVVVGVGPGVEGWRCGDEVVAFLGSAPHGGYAEYVPVDVGSLARKPKSLTWTEAGAYPLVAMTAWQATVDAGGVKEGERVLVHGGAGGVGSMAVQMARIAGATIIATASARNHEYLRELGASQVIDYTQTPFETVVDSVDVVLDLVGGDTQTRSWSVLKPGGVLVSPVSPPDAAQAEAVGATGKHFAARSDGAQLQKIAALFETGDLVIEVEVLPLSQAEGALRKSWGRHTRGKLVLDASL